MQSNLLFGTYYCLAEISAIAFFRENKRDNGEKVSSQSLYPIL